jgi:hypothetical protein
MNFYELLEVRIGRLRSGCSRKKLNDNKKNRGCIDCVAAEFLVNDYKSGAPLKERSDGSEVVEVRDGVAGSARESKAHGFVVSFSPGQ